MRQVLIVAYYFPPIGGIGSIRAASFAKFLPEHGWEATVLAPADTPHPADRSLDAGEARVVRTRSLEIARLAPGRPARGGEVEVPDQPATRSAPSRSLRRVAKQVIFPDMQIGWYPAAAMGGMRVLRERPFEVIFSSAFPITSHVVAQTLQRRSSLPWVAEFRDPWSEDPDYRVVSALALRLERAISRQATRVIMPTPTWAAQHGELWGRDIDVVLNGHDLAAVAPVRPDRPTITHVGTYDPRRQSFRELWAALARLCESEPETPPLVRFVGKLPDEVRKEAADFGIGHLLEATGFLPHPEAVRAMRASTLLIATGFRDGHPSTRGWIPAKLFEYLASGLPILYLGDPADDAATLLGAQPGCHVVGFGAVDTVAGVLKSELAGTVYQRDVSAFTRRARAAELAAILDAAAGGAT